MHKHLRRLQRVWIDWPIYFITTCIFKRRAILASKEVAAILVDEWRNAHDRHGWAIGRYVIMPDHVHFFCSAELDAKTLPTFLQWMSFSSWLCLNENLPPTHRPNSTSSRKNWCHCGNRLSASIRTRKPS